MSKLGTTAELANLLVVAAFLDKRECEKEGKLLRSLHVKLTKKNEAPPNVNIREIETALVNHSNGKVIRVEGAPAFWGMWSKNYTSLGATTEDASVLAKWLAKQGWLNVTYTVDTLYKRWPSYLAKAKNERDTSEGTVQATGREEFGV